MDLELTARLAVGGVGGSERVMAVAALFGVSMEGGAEVVLFQGVRLRIMPGDLVLVTGPSGAGKSTLLRAIREGLVGMQVMVLEEVMLAGDRAVVDTFEGPLEEAMQHLARAGLAEAQVCLRRPVELSEGQKFRYRLAKFFASEAQVLVADEFAATLDRVTAKVVAYQLRKFVKGGRVAIVATTHEDLAEDLKPNLRIWKGFGDVVKVERMEGE